MKIWFVFSAITSSVCVLAMDSKPPTVTPDPSVERAAVAGLRRIDFKSHFGRFEGCFVLKSLDDEWTLRYNDDRCARRFAPCSTFKIMTSLIGLETGVLTGPEHAMKWDGTPQSRKVCEADQTLATAIRDSVVWYFQRVVEAIGEERMQKYLDECEYGNRDQSGGLTKFWIQSSLEISANEQLRFLERLYRNELSFGTKTVQTVKRLFEYRQSDDWILSGKTGTGGGAGKSDKTILGWYVGHVRRGDRNYVFATNISGDDAMGLKARGITADILRDLGLIEFSGSFE
ncbi:MAG: class D beta-lactamase [Phycisphaerae bacterium]|nr:class D beta-lactamase [Phycisphaerae bacterium]